MSLKLICQLVNLKLFDRIMGKKNSYETITRKNVIIDTIP